MAKQIIKNTKTKYRKSKTTKDKNGHKRCSKYGIVYDSYDCRDRFVEYCWIVK